jgi:hypothetical protein
MRLFTTSEVLKATGLPANTFDTWCRLGHVRPINDVSGKGNHRVFDLMTVVGVGVAAGQRELWDGCPLAYAEMIVSGFAAMPEEKLLSYFKRHLTKFYTACHAGDGIHVVMEGVVNPKNAGLVDVQKIYRHVLEVAKS